MKKANHGFTLVEVAVVVAVIGILITLGATSTQNIQMRSADAVRSSRIMIISELLEKYYNKNGEYPSCTAMSQSPSTIAANTLVGINPEVLSSPSDSSGTSSILASCADLPADTDKFAYIGDGSATCLTGTACTKYSLKYLSEESNNTVTVASRHAPATPITAIGAISGSTVVGQTLTAGALAPATATVSYQWQSATTAGGTYSNIAGATSNNFTLTFSQIGKYIKVTTTGTGAYSGAQTSAATAIVTDPAWITIGTQTWAKANLNVGTRIAATVNQTNNSTTEKYCYAGDEAICTTDGGLYQWDEAMGYSTIEGAQGICPAGSHVPTDNDWKNLEMQLGMTQAQADGTGLRGTDQGTKLKSGGASGLNLPLAGYRATGWNYSNLSSHAYLWSSSESTTSAWSRVLYASQTNVNRLTNDKASGYSVRCLGN